MEVNRSIWGTMSSALLALAVLPARAAQQPPTVHDFRLGTTVHFSQGQDSQKLIPLIASSGLGWIRDELIWSQIETRKGAYEIPAPTLAWIRAAHAHGLKVLLTLNGSNTLYSDPYDADAFAQFASAMAKQLGDSVDAFEVLNEPQNSDFVKAYGGDKSGLEANGSVSPWVGKYVALLNKAAEAIKTADPRVKVVGLGSTPPVNFRELALGISPQVDGIADHPFTNPFPPEFVPYAATPENLKRDGIATSDLQGSFASQIRMYRDHAMQYKGPKELWMTAWGFSTATSDSSGTPSGVGRNAQAKYILRRFMESLGMRVTASLQYEFQDAGKDPHSVDQNYGLVDADLQPKPAYAAVRRLTQTMAPYHQQFLNPISVTPAADNNGAAPAEIRHYEFVDGANNPAFALWSTMPASDAEAVEAADIEIDTDTPPPGVRELDLMTGKTTSVPFDVSGKHVTLKHLSVPDYPILLTFGGPEMAQAVPSRPTKETAAKTGPKTGKEGVAKNPEHGKKPAGTGTGIAKVTPHTTGAGTKAVPTTGKETSPTTGTKPGKETVAKNPEPVKQPSAKTPNEDQFLESIPASASAGTQAIAVDSNPIGPGQQIALSWFFTGIRVTVSGGRFGKGEIVTGQHKLTDRPHKTTRYTFDVWYYPDSTSQTFIAGKKPIHVRYSVVVEVVPMPDLAVYRDPHGWQIDYLKGWSHDNFATQEEGSDGLVVFADDDDAVERLVVAIVPVSNGSLTDLLTKVRADLPSHYDKPEVVSQTDILRENEPAVLTNFTGIDHAHPGTHTQSVVLAFIHSGRAYVISARTTAERFNLRRPVLERMVKSFSFNRQTAGRN